MFDIEDPDVENPDRNYAMLTSEDRRYLINNGQGYDRKQKSERKQSILSRTRHSLADFRLLADHLPESWRNELFDALPFTDDYNELDTDVAKAIEFLYVGLNGQARFRRPLSLGVSRGEVELGNVEYPVQAVPRFVVHSKEYSFNKREVVELIESGNWYPVESPDLFSFVQIAYQADAIDFEAITESIDRYDEYDTRDHLLKYDETVQLGREIMNEAMKRWAIIETYGDEFQEFLEHYDEFQEFREEHK